VWSLGGLRYNLSAITNEFEAVLSPQIRSFWWLRDFQLILSIPDQVLFGDTVPISVFIAPSCDVSAYGLSVDAMDHSPFVIEMLIDGRSSGFYDDDLFLYLIDAAAIPTADMLKYEFLKSLPNTTRSIGHCYLCEEKVSLKATTSWREEAVMLDIADCELCSDGLRTEYISRDEAGWSFSLRFDVIQWTPSNVSFALHSNALSVVIKECDPGFGTTADSATVDCNVCPFNQFTLKQSLDPCFACNHISSDALLCEGGNTTTLTFNYWIGAVDGESGDLKAFYDLKYRNDSTNGDTIITAVCPPKYCCQNVAGCDYLKEYSRRPLLNELNQSSNVSGWQNVDAHGALCAFGRDVDVPLCGACLPGFAEILGSPQCGICDDTQWVMIVALAFVITLIMTWYIILIDGAPWEPNQSLSQQELLLMDDQTGFQQLMFKPVLYYYQSLSPILDTRGITLWISPVVAFFNFSFDAMGGGRDTAICWSSTLNAFGEILLNLLIPGLLTLHLILPLFCMDRNGNGRCCKSKRLCCRTPYFMAATFRILLVTIGVALTVFFKYLTFTVVEDRYLMFYSADRAAFGQWWFLGLFGVISVLFVFAAIFWSIKRQHSADRYSAHSMYSKFVKSFKPSLWHWEFVLFSRRFCIAAFSSIQFVGADYSNFVFLLILTVFLCLQIHHKPFAYSRVNQVETLCLILLIAAFIAATFVDIEGDDHFVSIILTLCIVIPLSFVLWGGISILLRRIRVVRYGAENEMADHKMKKMMDRMMRTNTNGFEEPLSPRRHAQSEHEDEADELELKMATSNTRTSSKAAEIEMDRIRSASPGDEGGDGVVASNGQHDEPDATTPLSSSSGRPSVIAVVEDEECGGKQSANTTQHVSGLTVATEITRSALYSPECEEYGMDIAGIEIEKKSSISRRSQSRSATSSGRRQERRKKTVSFSAEIVSQQTMQNIDEMVGDLESDEHTERVAGTEVVFAKSPSL
jgi:hypothetical protein